MFCDVYCFEQNRVYGLSEEDSRFFIFFPVTKKGQREQFWVALKTDGQNNDLLVFKFRVIYQQALGLRYINIWTLSCRHAPPLISLLSLHLETIAQLPLCIMLSLMQLFLILLILWRYYYFIFIYFQRCSNKYRIFFFYISSFFFFKCMYWL